MKGPFFLNFMIVLSCICLLSIVVWMYLYKPKRPLRIVSAGIAATAAAGCMLSYYGNVFPDVHDMAAPLFYGALASLSWFLTSFLAFPVLLICAAAIGFRRAVRRIGKKKNNAVPPAEPAEKSMPRRTFLKGAAAAIPLAAASTSVLGNVVGDAYLDVVKRDIWYRDLPDYLDGYKIGQLSDVHLGLFISPAQFREAMERLAAQGANRLEITGDLIDELSFLPECRDALLQYAGKFPDGIDFCYGNHEYYRGFSRITAMLEETPVRILRNSSFLASPGRGAGLAGRKGADGRAFYIAGTDYSFARDDAAFSAQKAEYAAQTLAGIPPSAFVVLLAHHSAFIDDAFAQDVPLTLCGHTHGAQFAPIAPVVEAVGFKYLRGMYRQGEKVGYVNRGTGHWLPFRVFCSREATLFELHKRS